MSFRLFRSIQWLIHPFLCQLPSTVGIRAQPLWLSILTVTKEKIQEDGTTNVSQSQKGHSVNRPPFFNGEDYLYWKNRMRSFIDFTILDMWEIIE